MTQAFNLSRIAGNLNTSGQLDATDGLNGVLPVANGGTGSSTAAFSGANITGLDATNISAGTLAVANGGTGASVLTANNVILGNNGSAVQFVAPGTNGNVLTSNGTTWASTAPAGGGGSFVYLASATAATSIIDFTGLDTTTYSSFLISFTDLRATGLACRFYLGGTLSTSTIYGYVGCSLDNSASPLVTSFSYGSAYVILDGFAVSTANLGRSGWLWFYPAGGYSNVMCQYSCVTGINNLSARTANGFINSATEANGIRIGNGSVGNLTGGNFRLYGIKNS